MTTAAFFRFLSLGCAISRLTWASVSSPLIANTEIDRERGNRLIEGGLVDMVAFGRPYIANPDLPERFATGALLAELDWKTVYASGPAGYTDYPGLEPVAD